MANDLYKLEITIENCFFKVNRTIIVPHDVRLDALHVIIQKVMGWRNVHDFYFSAKSIIYGKHSYGHEKFRYVAEYCLDQLVNARCKSLLYCYDMGDGWDHKIKVLDFACKDGPAKRLFSCVAGFGACPPEDVGGPEGYKEFCFAVNDPKSPDYKHNRHWVYEECRYPVSQLWPEGFDLETADKKLIEYDAWYKKHNRRRTT